MSDGVWKEEVSTSIALADTHELFKIKLYDEDGLRWSERFLRGRPRAKCCTALQSCCVEKPGPRESLASVYQHPEKQSVPRNLTMLWVFISPLNGWDCPCVLGWIDVISKVCNSFQEGRGRIKLEIFFYWEKKLNVSGNVFMKMFLYFNISLKHSDLNITQDCARLEGMKTKWI